MSQREPSLTGQGIVSHHFEMMHFQAFFFRSELTFSQTIHPKPAVFGSLAPRHCHS